MRILNETFSQVKQPTVSSLKLDTFGVLQYLPVNHDEYASTRPHPSRRHLSPRYRPGARRNYHQPVFADRSGWRCFERDERADRDDAERTPARPSIPAGGASDHGTTARTSRDPIGDGTRSCVHGVDSALPPRAIYAANYSGVVIQVNDVGTGRFAKQAQ